MSKIDGWNVIDADAAVLWREYEFTRGAFATTLVFRGAEGLVVVSPGAGTDPRARDALAELGPVRALVANNAMHHLGQAEWRARFPAAESFCPPAAVGALARKAPRVGFRPLTELALGPHARWQDAPGYKTGEAVFSVDVRAGAVWYTGDLLTNIERLPRAPLRWLFTLTGSAPGLRLFRLGVIALVNDKRALRAWALARLDADPPAVLVPGHGAALQADDLVARARVELGRL